VPRGVVGDWGDNYGNRVDRHNGGFAFVKDNKVATGLPSIIQQRGYYTRVTVSALTFRKGTLAQNWIYDSVTSFYNSAGTTNVGGGNHSLMAADTDGDLGQEIITGPLTIDSTGVLKCNSGMGHGDAMDVGPFVSGKGMVVFSVHENSPYGMDAHDAATCTSYFSITDSMSTGRGRAEYIGPGNETSATCSSSVGSVLCATGAPSTFSAGSNFLIYWDDDEWRELEDADHIDKAGGVSTLLTCSDCSGCNGTKNTPVLSADLLGDWREELVLRTSDNSALRVFTTTYVTRRRIYTLMHDPTYRAQVSFEQSGYNQPPHPGFQISPNMPNPPKPNIKLR